MGYVYDGDTIRLTDGRKVRLIGIDTPELGHDGKPDQPLAKQAKERLERLAKPYLKVQLRYDEQRRDSYGRTLAHVFLRDGTNVQRDLLSSGLATVIAVPPNLWQLECHLTRKPKRGQRVLDYGPCPATNLLTQNPSLRMTLAFV